MTIPDLSAARWRKSSHSSSTGGECVEIAATRWRKSSYSSNTGGDCVEIAAARWRKSTHSSDTGGDCVEIADLDPAIAIRDSKNPDGPVLTFGRRAFGVLLNQIRSGAIGGRAG